MNRTSNRLLIIDNEPLARRYVRQLARKLDYEVEETAQARDAISCAHSFDPSLIVLDLNLPDQDGIELLSELATQNSKARILIVSGLDRAMLDAAANIGRQFGLQISAIVQKPVIQTELSDWLTRLRIGQPKITKDIVARALANDEFKLYFQPTLHRSGDYPWRIIGVASFMRWLHPDAGMLMPGQFLQAVDELGLMVELTDRAILEAMQHVRYWQDRGITLNASVCIPWSLITDSGVPARLETLAREVDVNPNNVILEVSDLADQSHSPVGHEVLARLRMKEFQIAYNGFADLRASIEQLIKLPFTSVSLDSSLTSLACVDPKASNSVAAIIAVGRDLGMEVHANGVADQAELDAIEALGCQYVRGKMFSNPLPGSQVEGFVRNWNSAISRQNLELGATGTHPA